MNYFFKINRCRPYVFSGVYLFLSLCFYGLNAQVKPKKVITPSDYSKWGTLANQSLSEKGNWVSFCMKYNDTADTLFVKSVERKTVYKFPNAEQGLFANEHFFVFLDKSGLLHTLDLGTGILKRTCNTKRYSLSEKNRYLITLELSDNQNSLYIRTLEGKTMEILKGVKEYKLNNSCDAIICLTETLQSKSLVLIKLGKKFLKFKIIESDHEIYSNLTWSENDNSFAFITENINLKKTNLFQYLIKQNILYTFNPKETEDFPDGFQVSSRPNSLTISPDGSRIIFSVYKSLADKSSDKVQIWTTRDPIVYPEKKHSGELDYNIIKVSWEPSNGKFLKITDDDKPYCILNSSKDFALVYSFNNGAPSNTMDRNVDYYITDLQTGGRDLLIEDQQTGLHNSSMSPKGTYFAYLSNNGWQVYDFKKKLKIKLSYAENKNLENRAVSDQQYSYGIAGWSADEKYLFIYDRSDIWKASLDGKKIFPITSGFKNNIQFRVIADEKKVFFPYSGNTGQILDKGHNILISAKSKNETGFFILNPNGRLEEINYDKSLHSKISRSEHANKFIYITQKYNSPPSLIFFNKDKNEKDLVFQSNIHHFDYYWGRQEFIKYKNSLNEELNGTLYYPFHYDPARKYPMIVFIYEEQSYRNHYYTNPSIYNPAGFNVSSLTAAGYFVLMPDIKYRLGNPGVSAADCVLSATRKVIDFDIVDKEKIALMGQSFGGYETNFIVTQSNIFKTAVSGVSIYDLERMYLSISESAGKPELWRFESQQWRMGRSLFEERKNYENNSPSTYVERINTPMLLWCGEKDRQINPDQSIALYLALRRLGKTSILLMYPNESHSLLRKDNQIDLYGRLNDWLAFYLKDEPPAGWIKKGL